MKLASECQGDTNRFWSVSKNDWSQNINLQRILACLRYWKGLLTPGLIEHAMKWWTWTTCIRTSSSCGQVHLGRCACSWRGGRVGPRIQHILANARMIISNRPPPSPSRFFPPLSWSPSHLIWHYKTSTLEISLLKRENPVMNFRPIFRLCYHTAGNKMEVQETVPCFSRSLTGQELGKYLIIGDDHFLALHIFNWNYDPNYRCYRPITYAVENRRQIHRQ